MDWTMVNRGFIKHVLAVNENSVLPFYLANAWIDFLTDQYRQFRVTDELSSAPEFAACVRQILVLNNLDDEITLEPSMFKRYMLLYFNALIDEKLKRFTSERTKSKRKNVVTLDAIFSKKQIDSLNVEHSKPNAVHSNVRYFQEEYLY